MARHLGQFNITEQLLKKALQMAEETNIIDIHSTPYHPGFFTIVVEHPRLPETLEGMLPLAFDGEGIIEAIGREKDG